MEIQAPALSANKILDSKPLSSLFEKFFIYALKDFQHGQVNLIRPQQAPITLGSANQEPPLQLQIYNNRFFQRVITGNDIGLAESYLDGDWDSNNIIELLRWFARNDAITDRLQSRFGWLSNPFTKLRHWQNRNNIKQAKNNILAHYDIGNELYSRFLDSSMNYSAGIYPSANTSLEQAQHNKMQRILDQLNLRKEDHLLEIGTGWGGLAIYAASQYQCKVTTTTISDAQYNYAKKRIKEAGLTDRITLLRQDYRHLHGKFDKIVSVEMIEAVGLEFIPTYFKTLESLLKPGGIVALQAITIADQKMASYNKNPDFIQTYIFPGGFLPSNTLLTSQLASNTTMIIRNLFDFGHGYARTLIDWRKRLLAHRQSLDKLGYDQRFMRLWLFYFAYCQAGFEEKKISVIHLTAEKPSD